MPSSHTPESVPVCRTEDEHRAAYTKANRDGEPLFVVDEEEHGFSLAYDLIPTGNRLTAEAKAELKERGTARVEELVEGDESETTQLHHSFGNAMGNVFYFAEERVAREFAATVSEIVLDETNWEPDPDGPSGLN
ncbi:hypothetical protein [Haloarchaeobius sp. HME9146]|uniref:hypothetical protein n=1 Tax=Haloarchaeobius sp. HME9146 TaxID=2978732 RepID=UPI0021C05877|nr:hypothetical protein [Haloarchaeobius sp. HME9146]MCT9098518.1 hypothetical protein [Haloarchaeobius sp. HME9146]